MQDNNPVVFCDADDWLSSEVALRDICNAIFINGYFDVFHFAMQVWENYDFKVDYNEWLTHAHVYNLSSIYRWNVQFTYNLRMFDDLLFNYCILSTPDLKKYNYYDIHIYCWNNRNNSTSRWQLSRSNNDIVIDLCNFWHEMRRWQEQHNLGISFLEWFVWPINCLNDYLNKPSELDEYVFEYGQSTLRAFNQYITNNHLDVAQFI